MNDNIITLVVPAIPIDIGILLDNLNYYFEFLPIDNICVIGPKEIKNMLPCRNDIQFLNEEELIDFNEVRKLIIKRTGNQENGNKAGWYVQQFVKIAYSRYCKNKYYLLWDSDTIPLKKIGLFDNATPFFDCKKEYHKAYFDTIEKLFQGLHKTIRGSFISEHMLIDAELMRRMLDEIEANINIPGEDFQQKIINAINTEDIVRSGFSEFETFGTYVTAKYPDKYLLREWKSMRYGNFFFKGKKNISPAVINWLGSYYDAISFEKGHEECRWAKLVGSAGFRRIHSPSVLDIMAFLVRAERKILRIFKLRIEKI